MNWETVIGLEIHAQLLTRSKIFSGAATAFGAEPNTQACAVDLGLPGVLPVLNREAVRMAVAFGLAVSAQIAPRSVFARKNYFYPDLPKGYQISQYELPVVAKGSIRIPVDSGEKTIGITRAHLEEDAGKSLHEDFHGMSGIDLNRAGTPLLEIVSEPDLRSAKEAIAYMKAIHQIVRYLQICDGNMQEGSFRCDANVSVRHQGEDKLGTRCEIKNLNSFRFVERAIDYEIKRQIELIEGGGRVVQETRLYDPDKDETRPLRAKEEANDYRYFPDPDLLPLVIEPAFIESVKKSLPELPEAKRERFMNQYALSPYDAGVLTASHELADYYESCIKFTGREPKHETTEKTSGNISKMVVLTKDYLTPGFIGTTEMILGDEPKIVANWVMGDLSAFLNKEGKDITHSPVSPELLSGMIKRLLDKTISGTIAKKVFELMWAGEGTADQIIEKHGLKQVTDTGAIEKAIAEVMAENPTQLAQYRSGKDKLFGFFVGQVMKKMQGKAAPDQVNALLKQKL